MPERLRLSALRSEDLLALTFEFVNLQPDANGGLVRTDPSKPALVIVHFPSQHLAEEALTGEQAATRTSPVQTVMAGASRLAWRLPDDLARLPLTLTALLDWTDWTPVIANGDTPVDAETAIEFPWRLILSPDGTARWQHSIEPYTLDARIQLWRTSLTTGAALRAKAVIIGPYPFPVPLTDQDRHDLVQLTQEDGAPLNAESLALSTLGASASLHGDWPVNQANIGLSRLDYMAAQGRDSFIRTVRTGFLCGTGHRAVVVTTTERTPVTKGTVGNFPDGSAFFGTTAYLRQRVEVIVQEPVIDYAPMAVAYTNGGREMPLRSIRLITLSAEIRATPGASVVNPTWLVKPDGSPVLFRAAALDFAGNQIDFELPLLFVPLEAVSNIAGIRDVYLPGSFGGVPARQVQLGGQLVALAPGDGKPESTQVKASSLMFGLATVLDAEAGFGLLLDRLPPTYLPRYLPYVRSAVASIPAVEQLLGRATPQVIEFSKTYLDNGFNPAQNPAQTFVQFPELPMTFASQRGGGLARPDSSAKGLSRTLGAVAAPDRLAEGKIDLSAFSEARFLGTIRLLDLIPIDNLPFDAASSNAEPPTQAQLDDPAFRLAQPRLLTRRTGTGADVSIETRFVWKPPIVTMTKGVLTVELGQADLLLDARTKRSPSGEDTSLVVGRLRRAALVFAGAMTVEFGELLFRAEGGRKLEVGAQDVTLSFSGPLAFVNSLQSILPTNGFDDPPYVTVDGQGVVAGYTLGIPSVGVGIFSIQNIGLAAAISIPFTDRPAGVRFAISERHKPFLVTVSLFGGGGFFALAVSANGLEQIEAAIEFGGNIALNLVIASGGVYVMAGIYFALTANSVTLTGYLRCGGYLEVLGLISVSVEFYLAFTYRDKNPGGSEVWGQATLTVCVKVAFFSKSVSLSVERRFAGSDGDPSFAETVTVGEWAEYLQAFA